MNFVNEIEIYWSNLKGEWRDSSAFYYESERIFPIIETARSVKKNCDEIEFVSQEALRELEKI